MKKIFAVFLCIFSIFLFSDVYAENKNVTIDSFNKAKKLLEREVYFDYRVTIYCNALFDEEKNITIPKGFVAPKHEKRSKRIEWEHIVPAENFGRTFLEWREGDPQCVNKGKPFKGRRCAEKVNKDYRYMQADMYNLYPAIGSVNAMRSNMNFQMIGDSIPATFGTCQMKIVDNKVEPPITARGQIARTYKYMADAYSPRYRMSRQQTQLMDAWDRMYPVTEWECTRAKRIESIQKNENKFVKIPCQEAGWW